MATASTIVIELGTSRIKVGFAGEPRPRRILDTSSAGGGACDASNWEAFFRCFSSPWPAAAATSEGTAPAPVATTTTAHEWEKILYPLFSHVLTSVLFVQRASRQRVLVLINDAFPPRPFREALHRVLLEYLGVGGVWLAHRGVFESVPHLIDGLPPSLPSAGRPKAHLLVDIGTFEARVVVSVAGSSVLADTQRATAAGYQTFLRRAWENYQEIKTSADEDETSGGSDLAEAQSPVLTLEDVNAIVQSWVALFSMSSSCDLTTVSVALPSLENQQQIQSQTCPRTTVELPIQPLLEAFHQVYLDYTDPASLIYNVLTCAMACPIDYRRGVLQNVLLLGGGSVALRHFGCSWNRKPVTGLGLQLETAAREACGTSESTIPAEEKGEEKKEDCSPISSISRLRFRPLSKAVVGRANLEGERGAGIDIRYPDPFAADMAAWIGGSIMGASDGPYQKKL